MRVVRHGSGWDIALDMVFNEKHTAEIIAQRLQHAVSALVRSAVDASMSRGAPGTARNAREEAQSATVKPAHREHPDVRQSP
jgi:hypothetical protein